MICEICGKEKEHKIYDNENKDFPVHLETDVYRCYCPAYMLEELVFIRDNKIKFRVDDIIRNQLSIRIQFAKDNGYNEDNFVNEWTRLKNTKLSDIQEQINETNYRKHKDPYKQDRLALWYSKVKEVHEMATLLWGWLYGLKKEMDEKVAV